MRLEAMMAMTMLVLAGCAVQPVSPPVPGAPGAAPRRTVAQLQSLKPSDFKSPMNSQAGERALFDAQVLELRNTLALPQGPELDAKLPAALEAVALFNVEKPLALQQLLAALPTVAQKPAPYQRAVLSFAHTLFWRESAALIVPQLPLLKTPREFAIAAYTVLRADAGTTSRAALLVQLQRSFPAWATEPRLRALERRLRVDPAAELAQRPPLLDLLATPPRAGFPVVYSFQRANREHHGIAMVRGADGRFVRNADGSLFVVNQIAYARTNLPGTITNGNTPQGVFTIRGTGTATNIWIGPTPFLESKIPVEAKVAEFEHADVGGDWNAARYSSFLPSSWRNYWPVQEAFLAGQAGRDEMLLHGNTVNPAYYRNEPFFPSAPTAGCLLTMEYWSKDDGTLVHSDQLALVKAFVSGGQDNGYLVMVELDNLERPVLLADVVDAVVAAESLPRTAAR